MKPRVAIGSDHAGFELKKTIVQWLRASGYEVDDVGTHSVQSVDYPDYAAAVARAVSGQRAVRGIVICGSGVGACIAANKVRGVRACVCHDGYSAHQGVEHDDMNCLVLGSRVIGQAVAEELVESFLSAQFSQEERHVRRLKKVEALEANFLAPTHKG